jgi:hypothetical protein
MDICGISILAIFAATVVILTWITIRDDGDDFWD